MAYTPGVARVCMAIHDDPEKSTRPSRQLYCGSDRWTGCWGWAIWISAAMPVMEGKAVLFKEFAGVDAFPSVSTDPDEITHRQSPGAVSVGINLKISRRDAEIETTKRLSIRCSRRSNGLQ